MLRQSQRADDVVVVVAGGVGHRLGHDDAGGAVHDRRHVGMLVEDPVEQGGVGDRPLVAVAAGGELPAARAEVVEDDGNQAGVEAGAGDGAADETGAAGDEDLHGRITEAPRNTSHGPGASSRLASCLANASRSAATCSAPAELEAQLRRVAAGRRRPSVPR